MRTKEVAAIEVAELMCKQITDKFCPMEVCKHLYPDTGRHHLRCTLENYLYAKGQAAEDDREGLVMDYEEIDPNNTKLKRALQETSEYTEKRLRAIMGAGYKEFRENGEGR